MNDTILDTPIAEFLLKTIDELSESNEETRLVMKCLEEHLPEYFKEEYSDKMFWRNELRKTLIKVELLLVQDTFRVWSNHIDFTKEERKRRLSK